MKRKAIAALLVLLLCLSLCACGMRQNGTSTDPADRNYGTDGNMTDWTSENGDGTVGYGTARDGVVGTTPVPGTPIPSPHTTHTP